MSRLTTFDKHLAAVERHAAAAHDALHTVIRVVSEAAPLSASEERVCRTAEAAADKAADAAADALDALAEAARKVRKRTPEESLVIQYGLERAELAVEHAFDDAEAARSLAG